ncbi:hypothetical protein D0962_26900 [Leptolyngbyaceae cyanobacterium CCMR0082]|uniref:Uncharacterized protein n=1 Tax=Adonisia turfae CCMR0082 TaxID=2304604 RepID=A0A6M0SCX7_9CYAN|nr:hypothetical protein [Adonisia turfae CCMR0082]
MNIFSNLQWLSPLMVLIFGVGLIVSESWSRRTGTVETNQKLVQTSSDVLAHEIFRPYQQEHYANIIPLAQRILKIIKLQIGSNALI